MWNSRTQNILQNAPSVQKRRTRGKEKKRTPDTLEEKLCSKIFKMSESPSQNDPPPAVPAPAPVTFSKGAVGETQRFILKMDNFDAVRHSRDLILAQAIDFQAGSSIGIPTKWKFYLQPRDDEWIAGSVALWSYPGDAKEVNAAFQVKIRNANEGNYFYGATAAAKDMIPPAAGGVGWDQMISRTANVETLPLVEGSLSVELEFKIYKGKSLGREVTAKEMEEEYKLRFLEQLSKDMKDLFLAPVLGSPTVCLFSKDLQEIRVNKGILWARSPVLRRLFEAPTAASNPDFVDLEEATSKTVNVLLLYLFTGSLHKDWKDADVIEELIEVAYKFKLELLLAFLDDAVGTVCTRENVPKLRDLAQRLGMKKAEKDLVDFEARSEASVRGTVRRACRSFSTAVWSLFGK